MQLPINPKDIFGAFVSTKQAQEEPVSVSVYLDETAPAELVAHVRSVFASSAANARITLSYLDFAHHAIEQNDDIVVLVAGESEKLGEIATGLREAGLQVMVVAANAEKVLEIANQAGVELPLDDIIAPEVDESAKQRELVVDPVQETPQTHSFFSAFASTVSEKQPVAKPVLSGEAIESIDLQMGMWISSRCAEKRLAFALAFPFVRRPVALDSVNVTALENGAVGAIFLIPGADLPVMTINQIKMLLQIASAYGQPLNLQRGKELIVVVCSGFFCRSISRTLCGVVPILGPVIKAGVGYGGTIAMGRTAIEYFEGGAGVIGVGKTVGRARDAVVKTVLKGRKPEEEMPAQAQTATEKATQAAQVWGSRATKFASVATSVAGPLLSGAANIGAETLKGGVSHMLGLKR